MMNLGDVGGPWRAMWGLGVLTAVGSALCYIRDLHLERRRRDWVARLRP